MRTMPLKGMTIEICPTAELGRRAADWLAGELARRISSGGGCSVAFSGGGTPNAMFAALAEHDLDWTKIEIFQVDERMVPRGHEDNNYRALHEHLISRVPIPPDRVHPMPTDDPVAGAAQYGNLLTHLIPEGLDIVHMGIGDDGHTASWPPGDPVVENPEPVATCGPFRGHLRMTLTPPVVQAAGQIMWLVAGAGKAGPLHRLVDGDPGIPAHHARREGSMIFADQEAAARLG